jgi:hypothetical protein
MRRTSSRWVNPFTQAIQAKGVPAKKRDRLPARRVGKFSVTQTNRNPAGRSGSRVALSERLDHAFKVHHAGTVSKENKK